MYDLHIANKNYSSWSLRPWVLMRELDIPFREDVHRFLDHGTYEAFRAFSPTGRVPCLHDGPTVVWDSLGITEYLAERHPAVWPVAPQARTFARCAAAEMHSAFGALRDKCSMTCGLRIRLHEIPDALKRDLDRLSAVWSEGLQRFGGSFLAGASFTAVDAFFAPVAFRVQTYSLELTPPAADYARSLLALPSMREWYRAGLAETWREASHEAEIRQAGTWLQDLRAPATP